MICHCKLEIRPRERNCMPVYNVRSVWSGKYEHEHYGFTTDLKEAVRWYVKWSVLDFFRVLRLNKHHYGNICGIGKRLTDQFGKRK